MEKSLPARPSLEQLKKQAKELVKAHAEKQPEAIALIARLLPALAGKNAEEIVAYPFALHDAQSVVARRYGFRSWSELQSSVEKRPIEGPHPDLTVAARLETIFRSYEQRDYALYCSVLSEPMVSLIPKKRFDGVVNGLGKYIRAERQTTYMGSIQARGRIVHFWRLQVPGNEDELLIRMTLNERDQISGLLFSPPYDSAINAKK